MLLGEETFGRGLLDQSKKVIGKASLTLGEMTTILKKVEAVLKTTFIYTPTSNAFAFLGRKKTNLSATKGYGLGV